MSATVTVATITILVGFIAVIIACTVSNNNNEVDDYTTAVMMILAKTKIGLKMFDRQKKKKQKLEKKKHLLKNSSFGCLLVTH